jgi:hypothetical protein
MGLATDRDDEMMMMLAAAHGFCGFRQVELRDPAVRDDGGSDSLLQPQPQVHVPLHRQRPPHFPTHVRPTWPTPITPADDGGANNEEEEEEEEKEEEEEEKDYGP